MGEEQLEQTGAGGPFSLVRAEDSPPLLLADMEGSAGGVGIVSADPGHEHEGRVGHRFVGFSK